MNREEWFSMFEKALLMAFPAYVGGNARMARFNEQKRVYVMKMANIKWDNPSLTRDQLKFFSGAGWMKDETFDEMIKAILACKMVNNNPGFEIVKEPKLMILNETKQLEEKK